MRTATNSEAWTRKESEETRFLTEHFFVVLDIMWYEATFTGMKLAGIIMVTCGFLIVLFPSNWPDGITKLIRYALPFM